MIEFDWNEYLESTNSKAVPEELFAHVEASLCNGIKQGMLLEVCHKSNPDVYWIAEITMVCGHLLRIKFIGSKDDFWCDISTTKVHPLGWCGKYDEQIEPPDAVNETHGDKIINIMKNALLNGVSVSLEALNNKGLSPIDRIKQGMKVEVQNIIDPYRYWTASVKENVGGRLLLAFDGSEGDPPDEWLFFNSPRLSAFGFVTNKGSPWQFKYPGKVNRFACRSKLSAQLRQCAEESIKNPTPPDLFQPDQSQLEAHSFVPGMRLEALDPRDRAAVRPATVAKVFNNFHFLVVVDDHAQDYEESRQAWLCDRRQPCIYPLGWAARRAVPLRAPAAWTARRAAAAFDWDEYLALTCSVPAPDYCFATQPEPTGIEVGMKLEAVNPRAPDEIHVASVLRVAGHMLQVQLAAGAAWYAADSELLLPARWSDANGCELHVPAPPAPTAAPPHADPMPPTPKHTEEWCPRIYFNYRCYCGPSISRNKLAQLPKHVGPGPLSLVLKEVLNKLISASYKPAKLLKDWETDEAEAADALNEQDYRREMLKAKLKSSTYHAYVRVARSAAQVEAFCRGVCVRIHACPHLFSPLEAAGACAENCQRQDKARFHANFVERRGRKRKRRKHPEKKERPPSEGKDESAESERSASSPSPPSPPSPPPSPPPDYKRATRNKPKPDYPKSEARARGAKPERWPQRPERSRSGSEGSSSRGRRRISDVSDSEEPELRRIRYPTGDPPPSDNELFASRLGGNPALWSADEVHAYVRGGDCACVADRLRAELVDGAAFLQLDAAALRGLLHLRRRVARQLGRHVQLLRRHYLTHYDVADR